MEGDNPVSMCLSILLVHDSTFLFQPFHSLRILQVMSNQEAVDLVMTINDPQKAAKQLSTEALNRESKDDISVIVVRFKG